MPGADDAHSPMNRDLFRDKITAARRRTGHLQKEMADALHIDSRVLSRKLHGAKQAFLTHAEIKSIVQTLAEWDAISTREQASELLGLMGLKPESFSDKEWNEHSLNRLESPPRVRPQGVSSAPPISTTSSSVPASSTSLIGRDQDIQLLRDLLRQSAIRLLTLRGTGGVGKTRLAMAVARAVQDDFPDGVFFVPLAALHDATLVPSTLVQALHLSEPFATQGEQQISSPKDFLKDFLHDKKLLLVLDNVEQIPEIAPFISDLLHSAADLKIMVTSRTTLHLYGEYDFDVLPLTVSTTDGLPDGEDISQLPAVRLFIERARAAHAAYRVHEQDLATIAQICARLDGLPLAIELAAVRTKTFPLPAILRRLVGEKGQSLTFLRSTAQDISQRHQTLHKTLDWSYELLDPEQQVLFRRLSIFPGSWTLPAASAIVLSERPKISLDDVLEWVEPLLDHSLVKQVPYTNDASSEIAELRFYLLVTIREYGQEHLEASGEHATLRQQHALYYLALTEDVEPELSDRTQPRALSILAREEDNLRAALEWAITNGQAEIAQRMCGALALYWEARTQFHEAHRWIDAVISMPQETPKAIHAKLIMAASRLALWEVAYERSRSLAQQALSLYADMDDLTGRAWAIFQIADTWHMQGEYALAIGDFEKCLPLLHDQAQWRGYAFALSRLGAIAMLQGNFLQAFQYLNEAIELLREYSEPVLLNVTLIYLGVLTFIQGEVTQSIAYLREGLLLAQETNNRYMLATALIAFGCVLGIIQEPAYAARVCSAGEALLASLHTALPMGYRPLYNSYISSLQAQIDEATWTAWWTEGSLLPLDEVYALALKASEPETTQNEAK